MSCEAYNFNDNNQTTEKFIIIKYNMYCLNIIIVMSNCYNIGISSDVG